jgi:hypothetical protein
VSNDAPAAFSCRIAAALCSVAAVNSCSAFTAARIGATSTTTPTVAPAVSCRSAVLARATSPVIAPTYARPASAPSARQRGRERAGFRDHGSRDLFDAAPERGGGERRA